MSNRLKMLAIAAAGAAGTSSAALAQVCPPGYALSAGACQPEVTAYAPNNPVSCAAAGGAAGAPPVGAPAGRDAPVVPDVFARAATVCRLLQSANTERHDDKDAVHDGGRRHSSCRDLRPRAGAVPDLQLSAGIRATGPGLWPIGVRSTRLW